MSLVRLEPVAPQCGIKHSTTELLQSSAFAVLTCMSMGPTCKSSFVATSVSFELNVNYFKFITITCP